MFDRTKKFVQKIKFKMELQAMDDIYYLTGQSCFSLFPPSFYHTHTPEEIERITQEEIAKIRALIDQMGKQELHNDNSSNH